MSNSKIFSLVLNATTATKLRANRNRVEGYIQNLTGETVYISKSENMDTVQAVQLDSSHQYTFKDTDERFLWATGAATVKVEEYVH